MKNIIRHGEVSFDYSNTNATILGVWLAIYDKGYIIIPNFSRHETNNITNRCNLIRTE